MKNRAHRFLVPALIVLLASLSAPATSAEDGAPPLSRLRIATASGRTVVLLVEVADTPALREHGLMFRTGLPADHGMLLWYPEPRPVNIWMKDTPLPLDIIFIAPPGTIASIVPNAVPMSETTMPSPGPARAVLEINAGRAHDLGIGIGDRVEFGE